MQVQIDIQFDQLVKLVKGLPKDKLTELKAEIEKKDKEPQYTDLETLLLNGPTATEQQIETIIENRKSINQWRTK